MTEQIGQHFTRREWIIRDLNRPKAKTIFSEFTWTWWRNFSFFFWEKVLQKRSSKSSLNGVTTSLKSTGLNLIKKNSRKVKRIVHFHSQFKLNILKYKGNWYAISIMCLSLKTGCDTLDKTDGGLSLENTDPPRSCELSLCWFRLMTVNLWPSKAAKCWTEAVFPVPVSPTNRTGSAWAVATATLSSRAAACLVRAKFVGGALSKRNNELVNLLQNKNS